MTGRTARFGVLALAIAAGCGVLSYPRSASAFETKTSASGYPVRWTATRIAFSVKPEVAAVPGAEKAIASAMKAWSGSGGAPEIVLGLKAAAGAAVGDDRSNTIFYAKDGYEPAGSALAITVLSFDDRTGEILDADIVLNGKFKLGRIKDGKRDESDAYDVNRVVAHEMGHALGLGDEPGREDALMFPVVAPAAVLSSVPASDDIAGLTTLYDGASGHDDHAAGCGASVAGRTRTSAPLGLGVAALFGAGAVVLARRGRRQRAASVGCVTLAAVALVVPPDITVRAATRDPHGAPDREDAVAVVTSARSHAEAGLFHTNLELIATSCRGVMRSCPSALQSRVWGGTVNGIRQEVAGASVPRAGERVAIAFQSPATTGIFPSSPLPITREVAVRVIARVSR